MSRVYRVKGLGSGVQGLRFSPKGTFLASQPSRSFQGPSTLQQEAYNLPALLLVTSKPAGPSREGQTSTQALFPGLFACPLSEPCLGFQRQEQVTINVF